MDRSVRVRIFDTSLRDGEQAPGFSMTAAEKLRAGAAARPPRRGHHRGRVPDRLRRRLRRGARHRGEMSAAGRRRPRPRRAPSTSSAPAAALDRARHPRIHVFLATSDLHLRDKLRINRARSASTRRPKRSRWRASWSTTWSSRPRMRRGATSISCARSPRPSSTAGATTVNLPDTVGYALPEDIRRMFTDRARDGW